MHVLIILKFFHSISYGRTIKEGERINHLRKYIERCANTGNNRNNVNSRDASIFGIPISD
ncbi:hypothetical protein [Neobacillus sp. FSL H8-0543]|uniref:hypothetical protein n=1 Tax=Neobacillus sp. FSL H8-0543 TaxID=2954672 RepID=UPI0031593A48